MAIRKGKLILAGALFIIFGIFLFALVGIESPVEETTLKSSDLFTEKRRFAPPIVIERDRKELPRGWPKEGVDVVYFWTRPTGDERQEELETLFRQELNLPESVAEEMSGEYAQLQLYFARGLENFAPWFRQLVVVLPDSVTQQPFNQSDPRVRYVRHSQISPEDSLPIFNSRALLVSLVKQDKELSSQFIVTDDLTFPVAYISPSQLRSQNGNIVIPLYNANLSTPLDATEQSVINFSSKVVRDGIVQHADQLGFEGIDLTFNNFSLPSFETRGWSYLDKQILVDLFALCPVSLEQTRLHRLRHKNTVDLVQMHHSFIFYMNQLYKHPKAVAQFVKSFDKNNDGILAATELIDIAESLDLELNRINAFVLDATSLSETKDKSSVSVDIVLQKLSQNLPERAMRSRFRHDLVISSTIAVELRRSIPLKLQRTIDVLKSAKPKVLWAGPRILGPYGDNTREVLESFLTHILGKKHSKLETIYRPNTSLGLFIGIGYFCLFFCGTWILSKFLLRAPAKSTD